MKTSSINRPFLFYKHQLLPEQSEQVGSFPTSVAVATPTSAGPATGSLINSTAKGLTLKLICSFPQLRNGCFKDRCGRKESVEKWRSDQQDRPQKRRSRARGLSPQIVVSLQLKTSSRLRTPKQSSTF